MNCSSSNVTVIIPNWNGAPWLPACLAGLREQTFREFRVIIVDNASTDNSVELARAAWPGIAILRQPVNSGFAAAVNAGIAASDSNHVALLNNDTIPEPGWLAGLIGALESAPSDVGSVASLMLQMEQPDLVDSAGDELTRHGFAHKRGHGKPADQFQQPCEVLSACGGAALYRRSFLNDVGPFDESFFAYLEDVDLGLRGQWLGYRCLYIPTARVAHRGHGSGTPPSRYVQWSTRNRLLLIVKNWPARLLAYGLHHLAYGQFYIMLAQRKPGHFMLGWLDFLRRLPHALRQRRALMARRRVPPERIAGLLLADPDEPPLWRVGCTRARRNRGTPS